MAAEQAVVNIGVCGLGGYAAQIADQVMMTDEAGAVPVKLVASCDPALHLHGERITQLKARDVAIYDTFEAMLADANVQAVCLPLPIALHRSFTEKALAAGKPVLCEKPAAGSVDDVDAMIAARDKAKLPVVIGYQDVYDVATAPAKQQLLDGVIGKVERATVHACWPRNANYYSRNNWAGKIKVGDTWVLDCPANNAVAHYINIPLFLLGTDMHSAGQPVTVEAEQYRVNDIEYCDTMALRVTLANGVVLLVHFTHAAEETIMPEVVVHGSRGVLRRSNERISVTVDGKETVTKRTVDQRITMIEQFARLVRGTKDSGIPVASLEAARSQTVVINAAAEVAKVTNVPRAVVKVTEFYGAPLQSITGIEQAFTDASNEFKLLSELERFDWTVKPGRKDTRGYKHFAGLAE